MTLLSVKGGEDVGTARADRVEAASEEVGVLKAPLHKHVGRLGDALLVGKMSRKEEWVRGWGWGVGGGGLGESGEIGSVTNGGGVIQMGE